MAGSASPVGAQDICEKFKGKLATEWKREAACGPDYQDVQIFIDTKRLTQWMMRQDTDKSSTHAAILLLEAYHRHHRETFQPAFSSNIFTGDNKCILVFSILLALDRGDLVVIFQNANIVDRNLAIANFFYDELKDDLRMKNIHDADQVITEFEKAKWSYCPAQIRTEMQDKFHGGKWILPFCRRECVNTKGGTAEVYKVSVQGDFVPEDMKKIIRRSKYNDKDYGWCYRLAVKSFRARNQHFYNWERDAFLGIRGQEGMVQYLGDFSFDEAPFDPTSRTYNILLEYGDQDLDEYFFDDASYPPVRTPEIMYFWKSLFKVADALRRIHNLRFKYEDGSSELYHGWHADVKPDNILRVHGEFKLADFGFAKFKRQDGTVPAEVIEGGTQTYGSPECDQSRVRAGTLTPVGQTIDTWSFGCVLSITATWIVLGYQGVRQFEALRMQAIERLRQQKARNQRVSTPTADDAFHNGKEPLSEIYEWHEYLRGILRRSDTATPRVLDLVDEAMLLANPRRRITSNQLCTRLDDILKLCKLEQSNRDLANDPTKSILEALYEYEKKPTSSDAIQGSDANHTPNGSNDDGRKPSLLLSNNRSVRKSKRVGKSEKLENVPHAKTANRAEMLARELKNPTFLVTTDSTQLGVSSSNVPKPELGTVPESPIGNPEDSAEYTGMRRKSLHSQRRRSPSRSNKHDTKGFNLLDQPPVGEVQLDSLYDSPAEHDEELIDNDRLHDRASYQGRLPSPRHPHFSRGLAQDAPSNFGEVRSNRDTEAASRRPESPTPKNMNVGNGSKIGGLSRNSTDTPAGSLQQPDQYPNGDRTGELEDSHSFAILAQHPILHPGSFQARAQQQMDFKQDSSIATKAELDVLPEIRQESLLETQHELETGSQSQTAYPNQKNTTMPPDDPNAASSPIEQHFKVKKAEPGQIAAPSLNKPASPNKPVHEPIVPTDGPAFSHSAEDVGDDTEGDGTNPDQVSSLTLSGASAAATSIHPSFDIVSVRKELDEKWPKGLGAKFMSMAGLTPTKKDASLRLYIIHRDIKFIVDNGTTMLPYWDVATYVLETLTMKLAGLDDDGLDLAFTLGDISLQNERGLQAPVNFRNAMARAKPSSEGNEKTDMREILSDLFEEYLNTRKSAKDRRMTLIVLTDGKWQGSIPPEGVEQKIEEFVRKLDTLKDRAFSIQFIRFGDDPDAIERLRRLDDDLPEKPGVRDIIDTVPWTGKVRKMIIGSFNAAEDAEKNGESSNRSSLLNPSSPSNIDPFGLSSRKGTDSSFRKSGKRLSRVSTYLKRDNGE